MKSVYFRIMERYYKKIRNWEKIEHGFPPANRRSEEKNKRDPRTISAFIYHLATRQVEGPSSYRGVWIQQWISGNYQDDPVLCELQKKPWASTIQPDDYGQRNNHRKYGTSSLNITGRNEDCTVETKRKLGSTQKTRSQLEIRWYGLVHIMQCQDYETIKEIRLQ